MGEVMSGLPQAEGGEEWTILVLTRLHELKVRTHYSASWQQKMRAQKRCVVCGAEPWRASSCYCLHHLEQRRKKQDKEKQG